MIGIPVVCRLHELPDTHAPTHSPTRTHMNSRTHACTLARRCTFYGAGSTITSSTPFNATCAGERNSGAWIRGRLSRDMHWVSGFPS